MCGKKRFFCQIYNFLSHVLICRDLFCRCFCFFCRPFAVCSPLIVDRLFDCLIQRIFIDRCFFLFTCLYNRNLRNVFCPCHDNFQNLTVFSNRKFIDRLIQLSDRSCFLFCSVFIENCLYICIRRLSVLYDTDRSLIRLTDAICKRTVCRRWFVCCRKVSVKYIRRDLARFFRCF